MSDSDDSLSPLPSPSQLLQCYMNKVQQSHSKIATSSISIKSLQSPRIPPSGTPIKSELHELSTSRIRSFGTFVKPKSEYHSSSPSISSQTDMKLSDNEGIMQADEFIRIGFLKTRFIEFTNIFPPFPKTDVNEYAYVIELSPTILNEDAILKLRNALQYSLTGGGGPRIYDNVEYFASDHQKVPMKIHSRQCAGMTLRNLYTKVFLGVKACEFLAAEHLKPHTEVDEAQGHEWAHKLYEQQNQQTNNAAFDRVMKFYRDNMNRTCDRYTIATGQPCGGRTCIRAFNDGPLNARLFLGCTKWKGRESEHICMTLTNYDIIATLQVWGIDRVQVHEDILEAIGFEWETAESSKGINNLAF